MHKSFNLSKQFKHLLLYVNTEQLVLVQFMPNTDSRVLHLALCCILNLSSSYQVEQQQGAKKPKASSVGEKVFRLQIEGGWGSTW